MSGPGEIRRISSGGPYEEAIGYSRAVALPNGLVLVSGCTGIQAGRLVAGGPYEQARAALATALDALARLGLTAADVVRTRMYVVHNGDTAEVGRAHADVFGEVRPAATLVLVAGLIDPEMSVEIEVEAYRAPGVDA
ncbi:Rid family hydrolase [Streptomyces sp. NPDC004959]|uniref:Rid family hydrolase n=1 Tax=unclassified Streptomyces TaxID=2593676 RepID=UPI000560A532|nr:Rid family hydrolase [Streptomyces sp. NRRL F-5630]